MGIYVPGYPSHFPLSKLSGKAEPLKRVLRSIRPCLKPDTETGLKVRSQDKRTALESKEIHIPVAAVVRPVHKSGLGRYRHLIEQGLLGESGNKAHVLFQNCLLQNAVCFFLKLQNGMGPASGTNLGNRSAKEAPSGFPTLKLFPGRSQNIHIKKPAQGGYVF